MTIKQRFFGLMIQIAMFFARKTGLVLMTPDAAQTIAHEIQGIARYVDSSGQLGKRQRTKIMPHLDTAARALMNGTDVLGQYERRIEQQKSRPLPPNIAPAKSAGERYLKALWNLVRRPARKPKAPKAA